MLNRFKAGLANVALKFISIDEKLCYMFLETTIKNVRPIVILPAVSTVTNYIVSKLRKKSVHGLVINGIINDVEVSVIQTRMGSPSAVVVMEALRRCGVNVVIRLDYCGGLRTTYKNSELVETGLDVGSIVIPKSVFLTDGISLQYLQEYATKIDQIPLFHNYSIKFEAKWQYPSWQNKYWAVDCQESLHTLLTTELAALKKPRAKNPKSLIWSTDALFCEGKDAYTVWQLYGCDGIDMESSAVYLMGALFNIAVISILGASDLSDDDTYNLFTVNKIHPGVLQSLNDAFELLYQCLPRVQKAFFRL